MKKNKYLFLAFIMAVSFSPIANVNAAETKDSKERIVYNPCDQVLQLGEYAYFYNTSNFPISFRVDAVDIPNDLIYNSSLNCWIPAWSLLETNEFPHGIPEYHDQILHVGEFFIPDGKFAQTSNGAYYVYDNNAANNTVKLKFVDKWGRDVYVWVNAGPLYEYNPNGYCPL